MGADQYQLMVYLGLVGGLRREEIFGLEWKHIDWNNSLIRIEQAAPVLPNHSGYLKKPKTKSSVRSVSLPESVMTMLSDHQKEEQRKAEYLGEKWIHSNRIFTQWNGAPFSSM